MNPVFPKNYFLNIMLMICCMQELNIKKVLRKFMTKSFTFFNIVFFAALSMCHLIGQAQATPIQSSSYDAYADPAMTNIDRGDPEDEDEAKDPFEPINRIIFGINQFLDKLILAPAAYAFEDLLSDDAQTTVKNFFGNLGEPIIFINDVLQGNAELASQSLARFLMNSTLGFAGLYDFAANQASIQPHTQDLGITLARWGIGSGPYIMLPIFGPSTLRDTAGKVGDYYGDPYNIVMKKQHKKGLIYVRSAATGVIKRASILELTEDIDQGDDPYAQYRSIYFQNREDVIKDNLSDEDSDTLSDNE